MAEDSKIESADPVQESRRAALKTAAKGAIIVPAVTLLLDASTKPAMADIPYSRLNG